MDRTKTIALILLAVLAATTGASTAQTLAALPTPSPAAPTLAAARPLPAWAAFCQRYAAECAIDANEPNRITLTPAIWNTVVSVNRRVNKSLHAVTDQEHWGVPDRWDLAEDGSGDCEDYQLLKRKLLAEGGLPRRAMRMTVVIDEKGEGHAVLTLVTDRGDFILDNKTSEVLTWYRTGYVFIKRESADTVAWVSLGGVTSPVTTANR
ncbi:MULTISPECIES: transglutaminase-like cysteine peptidase [unclassified Methylobacterium]|uniref:transglutaminase-like cysteine peptidase n=1 Tax=unclassified Methylobacterium TaxID=2615210 RepID=UPI0006F80AC3|nr:MULTISPECIES: transglutaminase-like cysteine peptidase [unclassified Methylobacterium]KQO62629.1 transglutaminase [Methylobacterium sp. Leaf88]KQO72416.1 transglutaminase [Methylobacterium sp. Leaf89]KQP74651.1 transglutaminase [Methylobacterium sp. Leaf111]KQT82277.1 transglutaminase [Methylobacterium sp. Leaf465]KQU25153.1 transglutaminase [Methylobacterium sp. Leaf94]